MERLFDELGSLDRRCYEKFGLSEDILMEHAANGISLYIRENFKFGSKVLVVCGGGNNGADGITLTRLLYKDYDVSLFNVSQPKSKMAILQQKRVHLLGLKSTIELNRCDIIVDAIYGTGFRDEFSDEVKSVLETINNMDSFKIACDVPTGLKQNGECDVDTFVADISLTMGGLKKSMFSDSAKEYVGDIKVIDLGLSRDIYELESSWNLLSFDDMRLPYRDKKNTHKGSYGHLAILSGEKSGASVMSGLSALKFGSGLVTLVSDGRLNNIPYSIMESKTIPSNTTAIACGMGLGIDFSTSKLKSMLDNELPLILDADIFYKIEVVEILKRKNVVITPHPKEFVSLLKLTNIADITVDELQNNRFRYSEEFCEKYPDVTLILKGANVIIAQGDKFFINPHGTSALAKGGSGDILSGLVGSLLAQGYTPLDSAINGSLTHTKLAINYKGADFSLTPDDLINGIGDL